MSRALFAAAIVAAASGAAVLSAGTSPPRETPPADRPRPAAPAASRPDAPIRWRRSRSFGSPSAGTLVGGVQLPAEGAHFFTWDFVRRRSPNRGWRRFGSDRLLRTLLRVVKSYAAAHPNSARVAIGDLSRPLGGEFGARFGPPGHASHQNGLDVDVYYPRRDGREQAPTNPSQIDRPLAQDLLDRFLAAGAERIFVGPHTGLTGPPRVVRVLPRYHDNHMHVRLPLDFVRRPLTNGRSVLGRPIQAVEEGDPVAVRKLLIVGCIHGNECAGIAVTRRLLELRPPAGVDLWVVPNLNPDGCTRGRRQNARGADLNRNFPAGWRPGGRPWDPQYPGPRPASEPETRAAMRLILRLHPQVTLWFHQPQGLSSAPGVGASLRPAATRREPHPTGRTTACRVGARSSSSSRPARLRPPTPTATRRRFWLSQAERCSSRSTLLVATGTTTTTHVPTGCD